MDNIDLLAQVLQRRVGVLPPTFVIGKLERLQRNFIWDVADGAKKFHLVRRDTMTSPKWWGGFRFKDSKVFNKALLHKWFGDLGSTEKLYGEG